MNALEEVKGTTCMLYKHIMKQTHTHTHTKKGAKRERKRERHTHTHTHKGNLEKANRRSGTEGAKVELKRRMMMQQQQQQPNLMFPTQI
jgi:ribosomal protein L19E